MEEDHKRLRFREKGTHCSGNVEMLCLPQIDKGRNPRAKDTPRGADTALLRCRFHDAKTAMRRFGRQMSPALRDVSPGPRSHHVSLYYYVKMRGEGSNSGRQ